MGKSRPEEPAGSVPSRITGLLRRAAFWKRPEHTFPTYAAATDAVSFASGIGLPGRVHAAREPLWIPDIAKEDNFPRAAAAREDGLHAALAFPILSGGHCVGVVECVSVRILPEDALLLETTRVLGHLLGQFVDRERAEEALARR